MKIRHVIAVSFKRLGSAVGWGQVQQGDWGSAESAFVGKCSLVNSGVQRAELCTKAAPRPAALKTGAGRGRAPQQQQCVRVSASSLSARPGWVVLQRSGGIIGAHREGSPLPLNCNRDPLCNACPALARLRARPGQIRERTAARLPPPTAPGSQQHHSFTRRGARAPVTLTRCAPPGPCF